MRIDDFISNVSANGLAKTTNWVTRLTPPPAMTQVGNTLLNSGVRFGGNRWQLNLPGLDLGAIAGGSLSSNVLFEVGNTDIELDFNLSLPTTGFTISNPGTVLETINMYTESCGLPERDMSNYEFSEYGETRVFGLKHQHTPLNFVYYCSESLIERSFFEAWQDLIFNPINKRQGYYEDYVSQMEIIKYDSSWQNITATYKFNEVYPTRVGAVPLRSFGAEVVRLNIMFNFRNYERI